MKRCDPTFQPAQRCAQRAQFPRQPNNQAAKVARRQSCKRINVQALHRQLESRRRSARYLCRQEICPTYPPCSPIGRIPKGFGACLGILRSYRGFGPRRRTGRLQLQGRRLVARPQVRHVRLANRRCWMARISALVERVDLVGEPGVVSYWRSDEWRPGRNGWSRKGGDVRAGLG